jgi:hypothetical protein
VTLTPSNVIRRYHFDVASGALPAQPTTDTLKGEQTQAVLPRASDVALLHWHLVGERSVQHEGGDQRSARVPQHDGVAVAGADDSASAEERCDKIDGSSGSGNSSIYESNVGVLKQPEIYLTTMSEASPPPSRIEALKSWFATQDLDNWLSYSTVKLVTMRDRYLGILHHAFQTAIFIYIIVFVIIIQKGYMAYDQPSGSVQYTARRCTQGDFCPPIALSNLSYCSEAQSEGANRIDGCRLLDEFESVFGLDSQAFYAVTRVTDTLQVRNASCPDKLYRADGETCAAFWSAVSPQFLADNGNSSAADNWAWTGGVGNPVTYYIPQIENMSLKLEHNINALGFLEARPDSDTLQGVNKDMEGKLKYLTSDSTGRILDFIGLLKLDRDLPPEENVFFTLGELLDAAGVQDGLETREGSTSLRYDGVVLILVITYSNSYPAFVATDSIRYDIKVFRVRGSQFKYEFAVPLPNGARIKRNTHGVRMLFLQKGQLGRFSFQVLLVQLVSALALLKVATTIVDLIAVQLLPHKAYYKDLKYQISRDFSDLRAEERRNSEGKAADDADDDVEAGKKPKSANDDPDDSKRDLGGGVVAKTIDPNEVADGDEDGTEMIQKKKQKKKDKKEKSEEEESES